MGPEIFRSNETSDIYALAMTIYSLGVGMKPLWGVSSDSKAAKLMEHGQRPNPASTSQSFDDLEVFCGLSAASSWILWSLLGQMWIHEPTERITASKAREELVLSGLCPRVTSLTPFLAKGHPLPSSPLTPEKLVLEILSYADEPSQAGLSQPEEPDSQLSTSATLYSTPIPNGEGTVAETANFDPYYFSSLPLTGSLSRADDFPELERSKRRRLVHSIVSPAPQFGVGSGIVDDSTDTAAPGGARLPLRARRSIHGCWKCRERRKVYRYSYYQIGSSLTDIA
ncbi:hypothetical protein DL93DRAFT_1998558 [Clavulina sp. PMI_390]|nr:hypothetical protein DL93DRAFT_1998558 [Clavulina sp. PMI_390]